MALLLALVFVALALALGWAFEGLLALGSVLRLFLG
jgi:hypothetical protein